MAYYKCGKIFATQNSNTSIVTASGAIANFRTSLAMPVLGCNAEFSATQDLHGQSSPYPAGGGKNIAYFEDDNSEQAQHLDVSYSGYNDLSFEVSGTYARIIYAIPCEVGVTYTASFKGYCTADYKRVQFRSLNVWGTSDYGQITVTGTEASYNLKFTTTTGTIFVAFYLSFQNSTSGTAKFKNFMIEKGETATTFAPYENICPIVGVDKVYFTRTGKNLVSDILTGMTVVSNGSIISSGSSNSLAIAPVKSGYKYTITTDDVSNFVGGFFTDKPVQGSVTYNGSRIVGQAKTFIAPIDGWVAFRTSYEYATAQLELGETATAYEPYNGTTALINLGGTYYVGWVDAVTGKITLTHKFVEFSGSVEESWSSYAASTYYGFSISISDMKSGNNQDGKCNFLKVKANYSETGIRLGANNNIVYCLHISDTISGVSDVTSWKTHLSNNPLQIVYPLATPIVVYASNTAEIPTKAGLNNIYCDTGNIEVKYRRINNDL